MSTFAQLVRRTRKYSTRVYNRSPKMEGCPQKIGICIKVLTTKPKKPNSAIRKIAKIALPTGYNIRAVIPGSGHSLVEYNTVWLQAGRARDIPGIHYRLLRGKGDLNLPTGFIRFNRRSKFGIPNWTIQYTSYKDDEKFVFIANRLRSERQHLEKENGLEPTWNTNKYYFWRAIKKRQFRETKRRK